MIQKKIKYILLCFILALVGCNEPIDNGLKNEKTDTATIVKRDTIIIPSYGTINIIIPQREASVVNVEGYTESSFQCRVDLTKEPPLTGGGQIFRLGSCRLSR